jgi:hypothetical protein
MDPLILYKTLPNDGDWRVVIAHDANQRYFAGASSRADGSDYFLFVQIDSETMLELQNGAVDFRTIMSDRSTGVAFEAPVRALPGGSASTAEQRITLECIPCLPDEFRTS